MRLEQKFARRHGDPSGGGIFHTCVFFRRDKIDIARPSTPGLSHAINKVDGLDICLTICHGKRRYANFLKYPGNILKNWYFLQPQENITKHQRNRNAPYEERK